MTDPQHPAPERRRLGPGDAQALRQLRAESLLREPFAFGSAPGEDVFEDPERTARILAPGGESAVFGAFEGRRLVGMIGLVRSAKLKQRHRAEVYGNYVSPDARCRGRGRALLAALIEHARATGVGRLALEVTEAMPQALGLYRAAGFREWGRETGFLVVDGTAVDAIHMGLGLAQPFEQGGPLRLTRLAVLVHELDAAIEFYERLGFRVLDDSGGGPANAVRLVHLGLSGQESLGLWLVPAGPEEQALVGRQAGEHPLLVLTVEDAAREHERLAGLGVELGPPPRGAGRGARFTARDLSGNRFAFVQV